MIIFYFLDHSNRTTKQPQSYSTDTEHHVLVKKKKVTPVFRKKVYTSNSLGTLSKRVFSFKQMQLYVEEKTQKT